MTPMNDVTQVLSAIKQAGVAQRCGVQIELIDMLLDDGASPDGCPDNALVNCHFAAAEHLMARGAKPTLASAVCLERWDDAQRLATTANGLRINSRLSWLP